MRMVAAAGALAGALGPEQVSTLCHDAYYRDRSDLPAAERIPEAARTLLAAEWDRLAAEEPDLVALFENEAERAEWLASATAIVDAYFTLEDPRRLEPAEREAYVETTLESGLRLRGYIDRLDVAPGGEIRIVDYKTGRAPREEKRMMRNMLKSKIHRATVTDADLNYDGSITVDAGLMEAANEGAASARGKKVNIRIRD